MYFSRKTQAKKKCKKAVPYFANIVGWKKRRSFWHVSITSSPKWHQILGYHAPNAKILEVNTTLKTTLQSDLQLITNMTIKRQVSNESTHSKPKKSRSRLSIKNLQLNYLVSYKTHKKSHNIHCECLKGLIAMFIIIFLNH